MVAGARFYDFVHCTFCRFKERLRAAVCGKQSFSFAVFWRRFCVSSAISWRLWSRQNRFFEGFLHFTKHVLLYKKPARPVSLSYCTLKALLQEISLLRGKTKGFLNLQSVCCLYKSPATCFSVLPRFESLCKGLQMPFFPPLSRPERLFGLFPCCYYPPVLSGVLRPFAGLK